MFSFNIEPIIVPISWRVIGSCGLNVLSSYPFTIPFFTAAKTFCANQSEELTSANEEFAFSDSISRILTIIETNSALVILSFGLNIPLFPLIYPLFDIVDISLFAQ